MAKMRYLRFSLSLSIFLCALLLFPGASSGQSSLRIYNIDIGQGDSTLIVAPNGVAMLIDAARTGTDGGATPTHLVNFINGKISGGEITDFKYVMCSHYDADHIGGMDEVIEQVTDTPQIAYDRGGSSGTIQYNDYIDAINSTSCTRQTITLGEVITLDSSAGVTAQCLAVNGEVLGYGPVSGANDENELCIILLVTFNGFDFLTEGDATGGYLYQADIEGPVGQQIKNNLQRGIDIIHCSHHGSHTGSNSAFLEDIRPENAVISCGETNGFKHPRQEALDRLENFPRPLPDRPDLRPPDGTGVLNIYQTENGGPDSGTSPSQRIASTLGEGILISTSDGINYTVESFNGSNIPQTAFVADDVNAPNDIDGDGLRDTTEDKNGDSIVNGDTNQNGIVDAGETFTESNPRNIDTDADGISDGVEDCGSDGVPNTQESGFNPETNPDPNGDDYNQTTNPGGTEGNAQIDGPGERTSSITPDNDGDGLLDGQEDTNANGQQDSGETDPTDPDSDDDLVSDGNLDPDSGGPIAAGPDAFPLDPSEQWDTDGDGIGNNTDTDDDDDELLDIYETDTGVYVSPTDTGTDPLDADTDDDGALDGFEVQNGYDPNDPNDYPKVVINEVLWDAVGEDDGKEFVELYNPQRSAIDVSGFIIQAGSGSAFWDNVFIPDGTVIPSNGYYLIGESESGVQEINGFPPDLITDLDLQNAGGGTTDGVRLISPTGATIFDCIIYGTGTNNLPTEGATTDGFPNAPAGSSISRVVAGIDSDLLRDFRQLSSPSPTSSNSHPDYPGVNVKINEVCFDPAGSDSTDNEWIELYNPDDRTVDIGGFRIQSGGASFANNGSPIDEGTLIPPRSSFLIGGSSAPVTPDWGPLTSQLQNGDYWYWLGGQWHYSASPTDGVRLILPDNEKNEDVTADTLLYDDPNDNNLPGDDADPGQELVPDRAEQSDPGYSLSRITAGMDTDDADDWEDLDNALMTPAALPTDTDGDKIPDVFESDSGDGYTTNTGLTDTDGDTIDDGVEDANQNGDYEPDGFDSAGSAYYRSYHTPKETNAALADSDSDNLRDDFEIDGLLDPRSSSSPYGQNDDPDNDGLTNYQEYLGADGAAPGPGVYSFSTDSTYPMDADSDDDGMPDGWEVTNGLDPLDSSDASFDPDGDGLTNLAEYINGTLINDSDSDNDGMEDGWEVANSLDPNDDGSTDPDQAPTADPDGDTLTNYQEYLGRDGFPPGDPGDTGDATEPLDADSDDDGLTDGVETNTGVYIDPNDTGSDPNDSDSDGDTMPDGWEVNNSLDPNDSSGNNGASGDPDSDGLVNLNEYNGGSNSTDPHNPDSDGDWMPDGCEYDNGLDPNSDAGDDGAQGDPDGDGLINLTECNYGANAQSGDSDSDTISDFDEIVKYGSDPSDSGDPAGALAGEVLINEFLANPNGNDANGDGVGDNDSDEFVEFVNVSSHAVLLGGYKYADGSTDRHTFVNGTILAAGEAIVLFDGSGVPQGTFGYAQVVRSTGDLSLNNSNDTITLKNSSGSIIVDQYTYGGTSAGRSKVLTPELNTSHTFANHPLLSGYYFSPGTMIAGASFNDTDGDGEPDSVDGDDDDDGYPDEDEIASGADPRDSQSSPSSALYVPRYFTNDTGDHSNDTIFYCHNTTSSPLSATLRLLKGGTSHKVALSIAADETMSLQLADQSPASAVLPAGALKLMHSGPAGALVTGAVIYRSGEPVEFYASTAPSKDQSSELWIPQYYTNNTGDEDNDTLVYYANTTAQTIPATLTLFKNGASEPHDISLAANGTNALGLFEFYPDSGVLPVGALRLTHSGQAGSVVATGFIVRNGSTQQFYSFEDPSRQQGTELWTPYYFTNNTGDPDNDTLIYYANTTSQSIPATLTFFKEGASESHDVTLAANGTNAFGCFEFGIASGLLPTGALRLSHSGNPGDVVAGTYIMRNGQVNQFYTFQDPSIVSGNELWVPHFKTAGTEDDDTVIYYANTTSQSIPATLTLMNSGSTQDINVTLSANGTNNFALFEFNPTIFEGALRLTYTGAPGSFVASAVIFEGGEPKEFYIFKEAD